jgi:hypothetical protein
MLSLRDCATAAEVIENARAVKARMRALSPPPAAEPSPVIKAAPPPPPPPEHKPRWLQIVDAVALECGVSRSHILGTYRRARIVRARHLAMYVVEETSPQISLPVLGRLFGGRDHTTVLHAIRKAEQRRKTEPEFDRLAAAMLARFPELEREREAAPADADALHRLAADMERSARLCGQYLLQGAELDWVIAALRQQTGVNGADAQ